MSPGYFTAMGIPLLAGRDISDADRPQSDPVVVIGETTAKKWWPGRSPIGESLHVGSSRDWRIVGIAADVHTRSLVEDQGFLIYGPMAQLPDQLNSALNQWFPTSFAIRTAAHVNLAAMAQAAVDKADPEIPLARMTTMQAVINNTIQEPRFLSLLAAGFSSFSVGLTIIGLFGLLTYQVTQRTREIGVRMALGADRFSILRNFLGQGLSVAGLGVLLGIVFSWWMHPVLDHVLADSGIDPGVQGSSIAINGLEALMFASAAIILAAAIASWLPARRAAAVEPMQALRAE